MNSDKNDSISPEIRVLILKLSQNCVDVAPLTTLLLMTDEHKDQGDYKLINNALKELRTSHSKLSNLIEKYGK